MLMPPFANVRNADVSVPTSAPYAVISSSIEWRSNACDCDYLRAISVGYDAASGT